MQVGVRGRKPSSENTSKKGNGKLYEVVNRVKNALFEGDKIKEIMETLSVAQIQLLEGKGYKSTITRGPVVYLEAKIKGSISIWKSIAGFKI